MNLTSIPTFAAVPFANGAGAGYRNTIPATTSTPGAASMAVGFPPECFEPIASGGIPPGGADFNGILYTYGVALRWEQAGGNYPFDATFAAAIGGYPKDAIVMRSDGKGQWLNTVDANSTDPDSASASGWLALRANTGAATIAAVAGANAPTPTQLGSQVLLVTGALSGNATLTLPLTAGASWVVVNNTTGSYTLTVVGASGTGVTIAQGVGQLVYTDGTNYYSTSASVAGQYLPINGTAVAATKLATPRNFSLGGTGSVVTADVVSFDGTADVTLNVAMADSALSIAKTSGLQAALDGKYSTAGGDVTGNLGVNGGTLRIGASSGTYRSFSYLGVMTSGSSISPSSPATLVMSVSGSFGGGYGLVDGTKNIGLWSTSGNLNIGFGSGTLSSKVVIGSDGSITASGGFQNSDRRLKTNIRPRDVQRGFALRLARMFCEWDRIADGVHDVGLIAQRVKALANRYVIRGERQGGRAGMLAIDKAGIALEASMDNALQLAEQAKTIQALVRRIQKLEKTR